MINTILKYNPWYVRSLTVQYFEFKRRNIICDIETVKQYRISLEIKNSEESFFIEAYPKGGLKFTRGIYGGAVREQYIDALEKIKNLLDKVTVEKAGNIFPSFPDYDSFWEAIKKE